MESWKSEIAYRINMLLSPRCHQSKSMVYGFTVYGILILITLP